MIGEPEKSIKQFGIRQETWDSIDTWGRRVGYLWAAICVLGVIGTIVAFLAKAVAVSPLTSVAWVLTLVIVGLIYWVNHGVEQLRDFKFMANNPHFYDTVLKRTGYILFCSQVIFIIAVIGVVVQTNLAFLQPTSAAISQVIWWANLVFISSIASITTAMIPGRLFFYIEQQSIQRDMDLLMTLKEGREGSNDLNSKMIDLLGSISDAYQSLKTRVDALDHAKTKKKKP